MAPFIFGARNNIHIIDLTQTVPLLHQALVKVSDMVAGGGRVLFVGTKRQASEAHRRCGQALGAVFHQSSLARRHADQLEDDLPVDPPPAPARRDRWPASRRAAPRRRCCNVTRERDKLNKALGGIKDMGGTARPAVRDRHQQGEHRHQGGQEARHPDRGRSSTPTAIPTASTSRSRATTTPGAPSRSIATSSRAPRSTASSAARRRPASTSAPPRRRRPRSCRRRPREGAFKGIDAPRGEADDLKRITGDQRRRSSSASTTPASTTSGRSPISMPSRWGRSTARSTSRADREGRAGRRGQEAGRSQAA